jgi:hypothetical protein
MNFSILHSSDNADKWVYNGRIYKIFIDFVKAYDSVRRQLLYNFISVVRLIKVCLNEAYVKVRMGRILWDAFPIPNGLKQGDASSPLLLSFTLEYAIRNAQEN